MSTDQSSQPVDTAKMWEHFKYELYNEKPQPLDCEEKEAKRLFFSGMIQGLRIVTLLNKTIDIEDPEEKDDEQDKVFTRIEEMYDQLSQYVLTL